MSKTDKPLVWLRGEIKTPPFSRAARQEAGMLLRHVHLFDQFKKDGRASYAFRLVLQSFEKTLTDEEANAVMEHIYAAVKMSGWEVR